MLPRYEQVGGGGMAAENSNKPLGWHSADSEHWATLQSDVVQWGPLLVGVQALSDEQQTYRLR